MIDSFDALIEQRKKKRTPESVVRTGVMSQILQARNGAVAKAEPPEIPQAARKGAVVKPEAPRVDDFRVPLTWEPEKPPEESKYGEYLAPKGRYPTLGEKVPLEGSFLSIATNIQPYIERDLLPWLWQQGGRFISGLADAVEELAKPEYRKPGKLGKQEDLRTALEVGHAFIRGLTGKEKNTLERVLTNEALKNIPPENVALRTAVASLGGLGDVYLDPRALAIGGAAGFVVKGTLQNMPLLARAAFARNPKAFAETVRVGLKKMKLTRGIDKMTDDELVHFVRALFWDDPKWRGWGHPPNETDQAIYYAIREQVRRTGVNPKDIITKLVRDAALRNAEKDWGPANEWVAKAQQEVGGPPGAEPPPAAPAEEVPPTKPPEPGAPAAPVVEEEIPSVKEFEKFPRAAKGAELRARAEEIVKGKPTKVKTKVKAKAGKLGVSEELEVAPSPEKIGKGIALTKDTKDILRAMLKQRTGLSDAALKKLKDGALLNLARKHLGALILTPNLKPMKPQIPEEEEVPEIPVTPAKPEEKPVTPDQRWVWGTQDEKWHLVGPKDRDYEQGISQEEFKKLGPEKAKERYLGPSVVGAKPKAGLEKKPTEVDIFKKTEEGKPARYFQPTELQKGQVKPAEAKGPLFEPGKTPLGSKQGLLGEKPRVKEEITVAEPGKHLEKIHWTKPETYPAEGLVKVRVDIKKFDAMWSKDKGYYVEPGGKGAIGGRYKATLAEMQGSARLISKGLHVPKVAPHVTLFETPTGEILPSFTDGRSRFAAVRDLGAKAIDIYTKPQYADKMKELFGSELPGYEGGVSNIPKQGVEEKPIEKPITAVVAEGEKWGFPYRILNVGTEKMPVYVGELNGERLDREHLTKHYAENELDAKAEYLHDSGMFRSKPGTEAEAEAKEEVETKPLDDDEIQRLTDLGFSADDIETIGADAARVIMHRYVSREDIIISKKGVYPWRYKDAQSRAHYEGPTIVDIIGEEFGLHSINSKGYTEEYGDVPLVLRGGGPTTMSLDEVAEDLKNNRPDAGVMGINDLLNEFDLYNKKTKGHAHPDLYPEMARVTRPVKPAQGVTDKKWILPLTPTEVEAKFSNFIKFQEPNKTIEIATYKYRGRTYHLNARAQPIPDTWKRAFWEAIWLVYYDFGPEVFKEPVVVVGLNDRDHMEISGAPAFAMSIPPTTTIGINVELIPNAERNPNSVAVHELLHNLVRRGLLPKELLDRIPAIRGILEKISSENAALGAEAFTHPENLLTSVWQAWYGDKNLDRYIEMIVQIIGKSLRKRGLDVDPTTYNEAVRMGNNIINWGPGQEDFMSHFWNEYFTRPDIPAIPEFDESKIVYTSQPPQITIHLGEGAEFVRRPEELIDDWELVQKSIMRRRERVKKYVEVTGAGRYRYEKIVPRIPATEVESYIKKYGELPQLVVRKPPARQWAETIGEGQTFPLKEVPDYWLRAAWKALQYFRIAWGEEAFKWITPVYIEGTDDAGMSLAYGGGVPVAVYTTGTPEILVNIGYKGIDAGYRFSPLTATVSHELEHMASLGYGAIPRFGKLHHAAPAPLMYGISPNTQQAEAEARAYESLIAPIVARRNEWIEAGQLGLPDEPVYQKMIEWILRSKILPTGMRVSPYEFFYMLTHPLVIKDSGTRHVVVQGYDFGTIEDFEEGRLLYTELAENFDIEIPPNALRDYLDTSKMSGGYVDGGLLFWFSGQVNRIRHSFHDWVYRYGRLKRENPALYNALMKNFHEWNEAIYNALKVFHDVHGSKPISPREAQILAYCIEDKRLKPPDALKGLYDAYLSVFDLLEHLKLQRDFIDRPFQERLMEETTAKIADYEHRPLNKEEEDELLLLRVQYETLKNMRYLKHNIVAQRVIESMMRNMDNPKRGAFLDSIRRFSAKYKPRTGIMMLSDYVANGIISESDVDIRSLLLHDLLDYFERSATAELYAFAKEEKLVRPASDALRAQGWVNSRSLGIYYAPELRGQLIHPLMAAGLREMRDTGRNEHPVLRFFRRIIGTTKIAQFFKPQIIWFYDVLQHYFGGTFLFNPLKEIKIFATAMMHVILNTPYYRFLCNKGLSQQPREIPASAKEEEIRIMLRRLSTDIPNATKIIERITATSWSKSDLSLDDILLAPFRAISNVTWTGDAIFRVASVLSAKQYGTPEDEAIKAASKASGAYSELSERYKRFSGLIFFVNTFRVLMPIMLYHIVRDPLVGALQAAFGGRGGGKGPTGPGGAGAGAGGGEGGRKIPKWQLEKWAKSIFGAIILPLFVEVYLAARGYKRDKLMWKWRKEVTIIDPATGKPKTYDLVVTMNTIVNMPVKWLHRTRAVNPIKPEFWAVQSFKSVMQWEIVPIGRIVFWDILSNRKSFGQGEHVFDPNLPATFKGRTMQAAQVAAYVFGESFKLYGKLMDAADMGYITDTEKKRAQEVMKQAMNWSDYLIFGNPWVGIGYAYPRPSQEEMSKIWYAQLLNEENRRLSELQNAYAGPSLIKQREAVNVWFDTCLKWIKDGTGHDPTKIGGRSETTPTERGYEKGSEEYFRNHPTIRRF